MSNEIYMPVKIIHGKNCIRENAAVFSSLGKSCHIVTGGSSAEKCGALGDVKSALEEAGVSYSVFQKITPNPLCSLVFEAGKTARDTNADFIIGIGGGSPLDSAKAAAICAANPDFDIDALYERKIPAKALPLVLVGTTSGTGSEVTGVSVLTNDKTGMKKSISGADCYAKYAFLDSKYTYSMPKGTLISTALDALAHATEGYFSPKACDFTDTFAKKAIPIIYKNLKRIQSGEEITEKMHDELYLASIHAGLVINTCGCAFPHTVGYILTENANIPHGRACTAFMPYFLKEKAKKHSPEKYEEMFKIVGVSDCEYIKTVKALTDVKIEFSNEQIKDFCSRFGYVKNFYNTPGGFTKEEAEIALKSLR